MINGNSACSNGNSFGMAERQAKTLPWLFRVHVPGMECGQPPVS